MPDTIPTYHRARGRQRARVRARKLLAGALSACWVLAWTGAQAATAFAASGLELVVSGGGWGHGVGMSQQGALGYAEHGYSYAQILAHYFAGTALGQAPASSRVRVLIGTQVHSIPLETYVRGVVSAEMPSSWPAAALEAQAVATRTYALTAHAGGSRFDVYADTRSQVYAGPAAYTPATDAAVAATAGQIVTYEGAPVITYFFASSGGRTEDVQNAFPGAAPEPWLRGVRDPFESGPLHTWALSLTFSRASARLRGLVHGRFEGIEVLKRGYSPRVLEAYVLGSGGKTLVSGGELAYRLGLDSTWAYFSSRRGATLRPMLDRSAQSSGAPAPAAPAPAAPEAAPGAAGGVQASGGREAAVAPASVERSGGTSAPATAAAAYAEGTPEQIAWVRRAASRFVHAELGGDGAGACAVLEGSLRAAHGGLTCAARWDALLRKTLRSRGARAQLLRDAHAIPGAHVEVRGSSATIVLPVALLNGHSHFVWTENCWMLTR